MWRTSGGVWVAQATEDSEVLIGGRGTVEKFERGGELTGVTRPAVKEISDGGEGVGPEFWREGGVEEEAVQALGESANDALGAAVLGRRVWARELEGDAVFGEEDAEGTVVELTTVVSAKRKNWSLKLGADECMECDEDLEHVGFAAERESPCIMRVIIQDNQKICKTRVTND